jgi:hypothetical protein
LERSKSKQSRAAKAFARATNPQKQVDLRWLLRVGRTGSMIVNLTLASVLRETRLFSQ